MMEPANSDEISCRLDFRPFVKANVIIELAERIFGLKVEDCSSVEELESYSDRNFFIRGRIVSRENGRGADNEQPLLQEYVLKVLHSKNTYAKGFTEAAVQMVEHLKGQVEVAGRFSFPGNVSGLSGDVLYLEEFKIPLDYVAADNKGLHDKIIKGEVEGDHVWKIEKDETGEILINIKLYIRLLQFVPGKSLVKFDVPDNVFFQVGVLAGTLIEKLKNFSHPVLVAKHDIWDLKNLQMVNNAKYLDCISDERKKSLLMIALDLFETKILPIGHKLLQQSIHADISEGNVIVGKKNGSLCVTGLIDFGEVTNSYRVLEVGIAMAYMSLLRPNDCIRIAGIVLSGYSSVSSLSELERCVLYYVVVSRIAQSLIIGNYKFSLEPTNQYLLNTSRYGFQVLETFLNCRNNVEEVYDIWSNV